jgi:gliding motility-associated lipoprotein GldB
LQPERNTDYIRMKRTYLIITVLLILIGCHRNPLNINISQIRIDLKIERFDQDLFNVKPGNSQTTIPYLKQKYGAFFDVYNQEILAIGNSSDSLYAGYLQSFINDSTVQKAKLKSDSIFSDFKPITKQFDQALRHYNYYFPEVPTPTVYIYLSGFNQSIVTTPNAIGVSIDNYLGSGCKFYRQLGIPEYKRSNMEPEKIISDAMYGLASQQFEFRGKNENLISTMIYQGKLLYFVDAMIPDGSELQKIGYKPEQLEWCKKHESDMWSFLVEQKMLFSGNRMDIVRFVNPAPFTTPFGQKSPGRTGVWIGWQIVKKYLQKNPSVSLKELMNENDYHKILNESGYSPE